MPSQHAESSRVLELPDELRKAQEAINLPEVQEMLVALAKYNLGICMPHMHDEGTGGFEVLPNDMVQQESGLQVSFVRADDENLNQAVPVAWQWVEDGARAYARCIQRCEYVYSATGPRHERVHRHSY